MFFVLLCCCSSVDQQGYYLSKLFFQKHVIIAKLNDLTIYQADVGNAYLEAYTKEKIYLLLEENSLCLAWKVMFSLYLKQYTGFLQVANSSTKFLQICFSLKDSQCAKPILLCECDAIVILMNM